MDYIIPSPPLVMARTLIEDNIRKVLKSFAEKDVDWLKLLIHK